MPNSVLPCVLGFFEFPGRGQPNLHFFVGTLAAAHAARSKLSATGWCRLATVAGMPWTSVFSNGASVAFVRLPPPPSPPPLPPLLGVAPCGALDAATFRAAILVQLFLFTRLR